MGATLVVLAAGIGSRFGGVKQIQSVDDRDQAIIDYSVFDAKRAGFDRVVFVIRKEIEEDFRHFCRDRFTGLEVSTVCQQLSDLPGGHSTPSDRKKPWGTGQAVLVTRETVKQPFAVINADDFYGRDAYDVLYRFLTEQEPASSSYAIVGYVLERTLSENGTVSRGICSADEKGNLLTIREHTKIGRESGRIVSRLPGGEVTELTGKETVSMNLFGFTPHVFGQLEERFKRFLAERGTDPAAEFYIPAAMSELIRAGAARLTVLRSEAEWFGMTYREDVEGVVSRIRQLRQNGEYPMALWK